MLSARNGGFLKRPRQTAQPLREEDSALEARHGVLHAPEESLAARDAVDAEAHGDAEGVGRVQQGGEEVVVALDGGKASQCRGDGGWGAGIEGAMRAHVEAEADVCDDQERAGCEGDRPAFVVGVEDGFGGLLPERGP